MPLDVTDTGPIDSDIVQFGTPASALVASKKAGKIDKNFNCVMSVSPIHLHQAVIWRDDAPANMQAFSIDLVTEQFILAAD